MNTFLLTFLYIGISVGTCLVPSQAEALKMKFEPSITFQNSFFTGDQRPVRVTRQHYDVYHYYDPYTETDYYHHYPVVQNVVKYYPQHRAHHHAQGTGFNLKFKFK